jgi:hypothetical protein
MSMINASIATCAAKPHLPISSATMMAATLMFTNSQKRPRKKGFVKKQWKVVQLKPSAMTVCSGLERRRCDDRVQWESNTIGAPGAPLQCQSH